MKRFDDLLRERLEGGGFREAIVGTAREVGGQSSWNVMATLNAIVAATTGVYLEVGSMYGRTLCGAMVGNEDRTFVTVDSAPTQALATNVSRLFPGVDAHLYWGDFRHFYATCARHWQGQVSAYFYDADHTLRGQWDGLWLAAESGILADEAFVAVDDYSWPDTKWAVGEFRAARPEWKIVLEEEDDWNRRGWWNGLVVLHRKAIAS